MNYPVCYECTKSENICVACNERLNKGEITKTDFAVSRVFRELAEKYSIQNVDLVRAHDLGSFILVIGKGRISPMIGKEGRNIKIMSKHFGKKIRIIEQTETKKMVSDLIAPAKISAINTVFTSEGEKQKYIVSEMDRKKIYMDKETLTKAVTMLFDKKVVIGYEK